MILLKPFVNHVPFTDRVVRNNTSEGNNTIFSQGPVTGGQIVPGYNRFCQPFYLSKGNIYNELWKKILFFRPRYKEIPRRYR